MPSSLRSTRRGLDTIKNGSVVSDGARGATRPTLDQLPPHSEEAERAALGCVLLAGETPRAEEFKHAQAEQDTLLLQLNPQLFYGPGHAVIFTAMAQLRMEQHALNVVTLVQWLKDKKKLEDAGGVAGIMGLPNAAGSVFEFSTYLATLKDKWLRRSMLHRSARLNQLSAAEEVSSETLKNELSELYERASEVGRNVPFIRVISPKQARDFEPDPKDSLVGEGLIDLGMVVTIGGKPGVGKSRLTTTLAVAGARGNGDWMGYPVKAQWKTLVLQSENSGKRLKGEFEAVPAKLDDFIRVSDFLGFGLAFDKPEFRRELRRIHEQWPFQMLILDPWNDIMSDEGQADYKAALNNIKSVFHGLPKRPVIVIVAHLRKAGRDSNGKPKTGREILEELSGSLALGSESRTVFSVQPATPDLADPRIVFDIAKANDCEPQWLKQCGTQSAWNRANAAFERIRDFDFEEYRNPGTPERRAVTEEMVNKVFADAKATVLAPSAIAKAISKAHNLGESTVYRVIDTGYLHGMFIREGRLMKLRNDEA